MPERSCFVGSRIAVRIKNEKNEAALLCFEQRNDDADR
jgi:hypothetical protein